MTRAVTLAQEASFNTTMRNRIINGAMMIDQRNAGASVSLGGSSVWPVDRMLCFGRASGVGMTGQRSTVAPAGFTGSLLFTATTGATPVSGDYPGISQNIEGFNTADFGWGTSNPQTVTLSFWVRSSVTGTYGFAVQNSAQNRSYVAQYAINSANTWEYKTITITGDTSGTWLTDNNVGARLTWDMGFGFGATATANTWQAGQLYSVTGNVKLGATAGATFYITGVQLEAGTAATQFENRLYGTELALCQRYYYASASAAIFMAGQSYGANSVDGLRMVYSLPSTMRVNPTGAISGGNDGGSFASLEVLASFPTGVVLNLRSTDGNTSVWWANATLIANAEF
jgi:hypothetical protein